MKTPPTPPFPIVALGASAGGLEPLEQFLAAVPVDAGLAFVVVQHMDPTQPGLLPELLQRITPMPVAQIQDRMRVAPGRVYVIPPDHDLKLQGGILRLAPMEAPRGLRLPIDSFFRSLAEDRRELAVGIVLSGMGHDGTLGLRAIKEHGGLTLAQDPAQAHFPSMPQSALDAGLVDCSGRAGELPALILTCLRRAAQPPETVLEETPPDPASLERILLLLRTRTGQDFSLYKPSSLLRRLERRQHLHQLPDLGAYAGFLEGNAPEVDLLYKELLIGVTRFFRDPPVWQALRDTVLPALLQGRPKGHTLRAWLPGCSTGEEAYSLAMVFLEAQERVQSVPGCCGLQIFATDLDLDAIQKARRGIFPDSIAADVSRERLDRFFVVDDQGLRVSKEIREMVVFAPQNLIMDPPFTKLDFICCRNLLIYFTAELQRKLMAVFHFSLNPGGFLCLGSAETVGTGSERFTVWDSRTRLFRRAEAHQTFAPSPFLAHPVTLLAGLTKDPPMPEPPPNLSSLADQVLLQQFAPPAVLVNAAGDILHISGRTGKYLEPAAGKANWNILAMAREGLRPDLGGALYRAAQQKEPVLLRGLRIHPRGRAQRVDVSVQMLQAPGLLRGTILVVFRDVPAAPGEAEAPKAPRTRAETTRIRGLEEELQRSHAALHTLRQEIQNSHEELQSTNEEVQSTIEELTTSKEEMQSLNEELQTINAEQLARMDELSRTGNDLKNLLESTEVATLFLDKELRVRRFTAGANRLYKLIPSDVGRPLTDIVSILDFPDLAEVAAEVLNTEGPAERQALALDQHWYNVRIMPYRTQDNHIDGLVITFADVTPAKALETELRRTAEIYHLLLAHMTDAFAVCDLVRDPAGKVAAVTLQSFNAALLRLTGLDPRHLTGSPLFLALPALEPLWTAFQGQTGGEPLSGAFLPPGQNRPCQVLGYATGPHQFAFLFRETP